MSFRFFFGGIEALSSLVSPLDGPVSRKGELGEARETSQKSPKTSGWTKTTMHIEIPLRNSQGFHFPFRKNGWVAIHRGFFDSHDFLGNFFLQAFFETQRIGRPSVIHGIFGPFAGLELLKDKGDIFEVDVSIVNQRRCDIFMCTSKSNAYLYIYTIYYSLYRL